MAKEASFLERDELREFEKPGRLMPRSMLEDSPGRTALAASKPLPLVDLISAELEAIGRQEKGKWFQSFRCFCVTVRKDDGMSWAAQAVDASVAEKYGHFKRWCLRTEPPPMACR